MLAPGPVCDAASVRLEHVPVGLSLYVRGFLQSCFTPSPERGQRYFT
jgi:hypothetical protein